MSKSNRYAKHEKSPFPSVVVQEKYSIARSSALYLQKSIWAIAPGKRYLFSDYYLLSWKSSYLIAHCKEGIVERRGVKYRALFHNTSLVEVAAYKGDVFLSFRNLHPEFATDAIVLITLKGKKEGGKF